MQGLHKQEVSAVGVSQVGHGHRLACRDPGSELRQPRGVDLTPLRQRLLHGPVTLLAALCVDGQHHVGVLRVMHQFSPGGGNLARDRL